jgi:hypothetical protein
MKIVEIIVLMGTQCVSPIQHSQMMTEVSKVPCAVVIEKDSVTNLVEVSPPAAVNHPTVSEAMTRLAGQTAGTAVAAAATSQPFRIEPAAAARRGAIAPLMPPRPLDGVKPLQEPLALPPEFEAQADEPPAEPTPETASLATEPSADAAPEEPKAETEAEAEPPKPAAKAKTTQKKKAASTRTAKLPDRCKGRSVAKWYTNKEGRRKYRCVAPGKSAKSASKATNPLY